MFVAWQIAANPDQTESQFALSLNSLVDEHNTPVYSRRVVAPAPAAATATTAESPASSKLQAPEPGLVRINESFSVRHIDDRFGRKFTETRRSVTDNDAKPFETL